MLIYWDLDLVKINKNCVCLKQNFFSNILICLLTMISYRYTKYDIQAVETLRRLVKSSRSLLHSRCSTLIPCIDPLFYNYYVDVNKVNEIARVPADHLSTEACTTGHQGQPLLSKTYYSGARIGTSASFYLHIQLYISNVNCIGTSACLLCATFSLLSKLPQQQLLCLAIV